MSRDDPNEGHAENCACLKPGDRACNCHIGYGFDTAEEMEQAECNHLWTVRGLHDHFGYCRKCGKEGP